MGKSLKLRLVAFTLCSLSLMLAFQNCGKQTGAISVSSVAPNTTLSTPDPVTLISGAALSINHGAQYTNSSDVTLQLAAVGAQEMQLFNNENCSGSSDWESFTMNKPYSLLNENKMNSISVRYRKIGAPETACISASIFHDNIAPIVTLTEKPEAYSKAMSAEIKFTVADIGSGIDETFCKSLTGEFVQCSKSFILNDLAKEGSYGIQVRAVDKAGNVSTAETDTFTIDRTPPTITINGPKGAVANPNATYTISIADTSTSVAVACRLFPLEPVFKDCAALKFEYSNLATGKYTFEVKATDLAGNVGDKSQDLEIDLTVPTVVIEKGPSAYSRARTVNFEFSGTHRGKKLTIFKCALDEKPLETCSSPVTYSNLADNNYKFTVIGTNDLGIDSEKQSYSFVIDNAPPVLKVLSSPPARTKNTTNVVTLEASDTSGLKSLDCTLNGVVTDCSSKSAKYVDQSDGQYTFTAKAVDNAGNETVTAALNWIVDTIPDSKIAAALEKNPIAQGQTAVVNVTLTNVHSASYKCVTVNGGKDILSADIQTNPSKFEFTVDEDVSCIISGKDKYEAIITATVVAEVNCGNKLKEANRCVDFACKDVKLLTVNTTTSGANSKVVVPARTQNGICYAVKVFNSIPYSDSNRTISDSDVISKNHDSNRGNAITHHPYVMGKAQIIMSLEGPRTVKLSGGANATARILVDNFVLVGLYPSAVTPMISHYSSHGTSDSTVDGKNILFKGENILLKSFGSSGTATVTPLEIVREADTNLEYTLDLRALDCGGSQELSNIYLLFQ